MPGGNRRDRYLTGETSEHPVFCRLRNAGASPFGRPLDMRDRATLRESDVHPFRRAAQTRRKRTPRSARGDPSAHAFPDAGWDPLWVRHLLDDARWRIDMPEKRTIERARRAARQGKAPTTVAGEFVREEIDHVRRGKHGARSAKQAIAIGLSKARRAGVRLAAPKKGQGASEGTRRKARADLRRGKRARPVSAKRSAASQGALRRESREAASPRALAYQARKARRRKAAKAPTRATGAATSSRSGRGSQSAKKGRTAVTRQRQNKSKGRTR